MAKKISLTKRGRDKLVEELENLKKVKRPAVVERIKRARDYGDLSENAEYEDARNEQSFVEGRIQELEHIIKYAEVSEKSGGGKVALGSQVTVEIDKEKFTYEIVGSTEADPMSGKISSDSPIGSAILGKGIGEKILAQTPSGEIKLTIVSVG